MWRCSNCGLIWPGEDVPDTCPKCGASTRRFEAVDARSADLIERAKYTNSLHMNLYALLEQVMALAEEGIEDNLDPGCVRVFAQASDQAEVLQQAILAELQTHATKGKWG
ncbi:MAG: rubredoxin [Anaerolineae bacterium]|jgi:hypothetical protein